MQKQKDNFPSQLPQELPFSPFPTVQYPSFYYKEQSKIQGLDVQNRIGFNILKFSRFQEDFVIYFIQILQWNCKFLKLHILEPSHLYVEFSYRVQNFECQQQNLGIFQKKIVDLLQFVKVSYEKFTKTRLQNFILDKMDITSEQLVNKFKTEVTQPINQKYSQIFVNE